MGRGPVIQQKKEAAANERGKVYGIHSKLIALAAQGGTDEALNPALANAIASAKKASVPTDIIERAIRRGSGQDKDASAVEAILYEGYGPGGVGLIVRALTDNRNRTAPNMRHIFSAFGGSLGETGSVSNFLFSYHGVIEVDISALGVIWFEGMILETDAEDYTIEWEYATVLTDRSALHTTSERLSHEGCIIRSASLEYKANTYVKVTDFDKALKIYKMLEAFEEDEDVEKVWNNADVSDALWQEVETFIESKKFRT